MSRSPAARRLSLAAIVLWTRLAAAPAVAAPSVGPERSPPVTLTHRAWTTDEGLPQNAVLAIDQTPNGYLWLGTQEGLARFDGVRFRVFDRATAPGWPRSVIGALYAAPDGVVWIGTEDGRLLCLRGEQLASVAVPSSLTRVRVIRPARGGGLWLGGSGGLVRLPADRGEGAVMSLLTGQEVMALQEDRDGNLWVGSLEGLHRCHTSECTPMASRVGLSGRAVTALCIDESSGLWIGTSSAGLFRLAAPPSADDPTGRAEALGPAGEHVVSLLRDGSGTVWMATEHGLMNVHGGRVDTRAGEPHGLTGRTFSLFQDREGSLWVGTYYSGLTRLSPSKFMTYGRHGSRGYPPTATVYEDRHGVVWFGTFGSGLGRLSPEGLSFYDRRHGLPQDVGPIIEDSAGALWLGVHSDGMLYRMRRGRLSAVPLGSHPVRTFHEDPEGALWMGTAGAGLIRWRRGERAQWTTKQGLPSDTVRVIRPDGAGGLWLATLAGLVHFRESGLKVYTVADGLPSNWISALHVEPGGPLWIGTSNGLARYEHGRFTTYGTAQGFGGESVFTLLDDGRGSLWMGANKGVFQVSKRQLDEVARGTRAMVSCTTYGRGDGMESAECNGGIQPSGWKGRDGRLWFATVKGVVVVDPAQVTVNNPLPPPVSIEEVHADGRPLPGDGRLPAGTKRLEIVYTAPSFVAPERVRFRYRLVGFDKDWVDASHHRAASYTRLRPGPYLFEVTASRNDGAWNEDAALLRFVVAPFFYETAWFHAAAAVLVAAAVWGVHALRVRGLRLRNQVLAERARLGQEIHDRMSQLMTGVILQLDAAQQTLPQGPGICQPYMDRASRLAKQAIDEARRILRGLPDPALDRPDVGTGVLTSVASIIEGTDVRVVVREEGAAFPLPADVKSDLFQIAQEAVTNALRHGGARRIEIVIHFSGDGVRLVVADDGSGFKPSPSAAPAGLGLPGIARRVQARRGSLDIEGRPGGGTTVTAFLPRP